MGVGQAPAPDLGDSGLITAKTFASLGSVWHASVPSLEQFTRWVNNHDRSFGDRVRRRGDTGRSALIAETAFEAASRGPGVAPDVESAARKFLDGLPRPPKGGPLTSGELAEVEQIAENLRTFLGADWQEVTFHPEFPGCGVVGRAVGDVLDGSRLIEVKTVDRGFRGSDFRQALTYAALAYSADMPIDRITLFNPRRATYYSTDVTNLAHDLGSASWIDLMQYLIDSMTEVGVSQ